jgi:hypothetical protein
MTTGALDRRRKALEEDFFAKKNQQLLDKLKQTFDRDVTRESLRATTGITDAAVLDRLIALRVNGETMAAFALYPLVEVAWADGKLDARRRRDPLHRERRRRENSPTQMLENRWLTGRSVWPASGEVRADPRRPAPAERRSCAGPAAARAPYRATAACSAVSAKGKAST